MAAAQLAISRFDAVRTAAESGVRTQIQQTTAEMIASPKNERDAAAAALNEARGVALRATLKRRQQRDGRKQRRQSAKLLALRLRRPGR